ncbi:hypothetical protein Ahy_A07g036509 [Arachis hypogaea]|uniref:Uncharacterized protein n=1 Tax=Arachis hypogaea TaxID=3818 RepID=A0A445CGC7_ARAHY|nr:hypothetical protein Ahy_A07g036509 [Arachis hypogaea]
MAKKMASQGDTSSKDNLRWTEEMDAAFLDALIEECSKGNRVDGTFTTTAYDNGFDCEWNDWQPTTHSTSFVAEESPNLGNSNQSNGTQENHRGAKRKAPMSGLFEADMERMSKGIQGLTDMLKDGNSYYDKSLDIATKQALTAERQAETAEKQVMLAERQVLIAEEQIQVAKMQAQAVERGITFLEQSRTRVYSENDVYNELKKLGVVKEIFWSCYRFLCRDERAKREFFGVPFEDRHGALYDLMKEAGAI